MNEKNRINGTTDIPNDDISFLKGITKKSKTPFTNCSNLFLVLAGYMLITNHIWQAVRSSITLSPYSSYILSVISLVFTALQLVILLYYRKIMKQNEEFINLKLIDSCGFLIIVSSAIVPIINYSSLGRYSLPGNYNLIMAATLCIFMCGSFLNQKSLKYLSYIYIAVVVLILILIRCVFNYYENNDDIINKINKLSDVLYVILPPVGYALLGLFLRRDNKIEITNKSEAE